jgi:5-methylcytosine-specific restriction endonuclease McrA
MLTEGTDIPDVQTVFITRQTTSKILMTQMVGRALRGPKFGGTTNAFLVFFSDDWKQTIHWAEYNELGAEGVDDKIPEYGRRPPLQLISIELVRKLARQMDTGINIEKQAFLTLLPIGWYRVNYTTTISGSEDSEQVQRLVMIFEHESSNFTNLIDALAKQDIECYAAEDLRLNDIMPEIEKWKAIYFSTAFNHLATILEEDIFDILRHFAQNGTAPAFFQFEERDRHNLDDIAQQVYEKEYSIRVIDEVLHTEYKRNDRYWATLYSPYQLFKSQFDGCLNRVLELQRHGMTSSLVKINYQTPEAVPERETSEEIKRQVRKRDGNKCLCCGSTKKLQVDHIHAWHLGGSNLLDNLQTLCSKGNSAKKTRNINFRDPQTERKTPLSELQMIEMPSAVENLGNSAKWKEFIRRCINFFYECGAVQNITIGDRGYPFYHWRVELGAGNDPQWLALHLENLLHQIRQAKESAGFGVPISLTISAPGYKGESVSFGNDDSELDRDKFYEIRKESALPSKREIVSVLDRACLQQIARSFEIDVEDARSKNCLIDAISRARRAPLQEILTNVSLGDLRFICETLDVAPDGRTKADLIACLIGTCSGSK